MAKKVACPQCGAKNTPDTRRCRICAQLLNPDAEDPTVRPKGLPEHVQRQIDKTMAAQDAGGGPPPPPAGGFGGLGAPQGEPAAGDWGAPAPAPAGWTEADTWPSGPTAEPADAGWGGDEGSWDDGAGIVIEAAPRNPGVVDEEPPPPPADAPLFDPNALFEEMGRTDLAPPVVRPDLPPPPGAPPPPASDELTLPPPEPKADPFADLHVDGELSSEEIERLTQERLREDRLKRRSGFLNKVFQADDEADPPPGELRPF